MIISPPFLPDWPAGQTETQWLDIAMRAPASRLPDTQAPEGSFPLSHNLAWHNGMHLQAPQVNGADLPVRVIADGKVVFANPPAQANDKLDDPQNYNPFDRPGVRTPAWTDNGCVIIEHRTSIGADGDQETEVVFYSLYMHLSKLVRIVPPGETMARQLRAGDAIWRKDELGRPGRIYGHGGQIHFEICFDAANLQRLIGRAPNWTNPEARSTPTADGRTDSIFGSLYFYLPAATPVDAGAAVPTQHLRRLSGPTLGSAVWVRMTYERGGCTFETFDERGGLIGAMPVHDGAEYSLSSQATARHATLPHSERARSSPSGWYELLRFGRNIGRGPNATDKDPLPSNAAHWRRIIGAQGRPLWADLNAEGSFKFSDADFLSVMGWNCFDDDTNPQDQRCDSERLRQLIQDPDPANAQRMEASALARRLGNGEVQRKLRRAFCRFSSEWQRADIQIRYGFVQQSPAFAEAPDAWVRLQNHLQTLSFNDLPATYLAADWRPHPKEFVGFLRQCGWLSRTEATQTLPRSFIAEHHGTRTIYRASVSAAQARGRIEGMRQVLCRIMRKYLIDSRQRQSVFLANAIVESTYLNQFFEAGRGAGKRYGDWYGRGIIQVTWEENYLKYFSYLGRDTSNAAQNIRWRDELETSVHARCDSAGFWWLQNAANRHASVPLPNQDWRVTVCENFDFRRRVCIGAAITETRLSNPTLDAVGRLVNTGSVGTTVQVNGLIERRDIFTHVQVVLMEYLYRDDAGALPQTRPEFFRAQR